MQPAAAQVSPESGFMGRNINLKCHLLPVTIMSFRLSFGLGGTVWAVS